MSGLKHFGKRIRREFPQGGLIGKTMALWKRISALQIPMHAGYASYFIVLAVFPALLLALALLRYTGLQIRDLMEVIGDFMPSALLSMAEGVIYRLYKSSSGAIIGVSAITALWSASKGVYGILRGLNAIYGVSEDRGYVYTRGISVVYTFFLMVILVLTLVLHVFGNSLISLLALAERPVLSFIGEIIDFRFFFLLILQSLFFTLMYMKLPNRRNRFLDSLPGGVLASIGWMVFSDLYSIYVEKFSRYASIYGSVYTIALSLLWLYCCLNILFYGGVLNRLLVGKPENVDNL